MKRNSFPKGDLKSGYVVMLRNGEYRIVARAGDFTHILVNPQTQEWNYLSAWDDNLDYVRSYTFRPYGSIKDPDKSRDIVEVYGLIKGTAIYGHVFEPCVNHRELLWERSTPKKMTIEEISAELGYEVEIVAASQK